MQFFSQIKRRMFMLAALSLMTAAANASSTAPQPGVEYQVLKRPQPVDSGKKIEVIEFFGYFCPHCHALEPLIAEWVKKQGDNISFKRIHVNFHDLVPQQKLYFTMEAMGKADEYHMKAFTAFHVERNRLQTDADIMEFVSKSGLDKQKFSDIYNSFSITSKLSRATQLASAYQIDGVPSIAVDGRYVTSPVLAVTTSTTRVTEEIQNRAVIQVLDALIAKVQKEKNAAAAPAASASPASAAASAASSSSTKVPAKKK